MREQPGNLYDNIEQQDPMLPVRLKKVTRRKRASAQVRNAAIEVTVPQHWPTSYQNDVAKQLAQRVQQQFQRDLDLVLGDNSPRLTLNSKKELEDWVIRINRETLHVPLAGVRMGYARYSHLAQMNLRTKVMTVSKYCLRDVPEAALKSLIVHELAHLKVPNHSKAFWDEVRRFIPDLKHQRRLIAAVHRLRIYEADQAKASSAEKPKQVPSIKTVPTQIESVSLLKQLLLRLF